MSTFGSRILLIGNGRLARHFAQDWPQALPQHTFQRWNRSQPLAELDHLMQNADVIALGISDSALKDFVAAHFSKNPQALWIHFSGALEIPNATSIHPLMSFGPELYTTEQYRQIPYVTVHSADAGQPTWPEALPLPNPLYAIPAESKARYHALCVLSANFSTLLWAKAQTEFEKLNLDPQILKPIAEMGIKNVFRDRSSALTGPLVRNDLTTQQKNLSALSGDPFQEIYLAFQKAYKQESP